MDSISTQGKSGNFPDFPDRFQWFHNARFGMFVHYGLYSMLGRSEWVMFRKRIPPVAGTCPLTPAFRF